MNLKDIEHYFSQWDVNLFLAGQVFAIVFFTLLINWIVSRVLFKAQRKLEATDNLWDDAIIHALQRPISIYIWAIGISIAIQLLGFSKIVVIRELGLIIFIGWTLFRLVTFVEQNIISHSRLAGIEIDKTTANAISQLLRVSIVITSSLVGLESIGFNLSAILAFGGIGGIAIGFAAKDLLSNFFGGIMIYLDRPFAIGDWIRSPDKNIEGTVEKIGWRLTIIRTFDKRPLYIPNSVFATIAVENPSRMTHRRIYETFGVRYQDIHKMPLIIDDVKSMLLNHDDIDNTQTMIVNFNTYAAYSLDFFVYTFTKTKNWIEFHNVKQDVLFKINEILEQHNAEFAYPTSSVHLPDGIELHRSGLHETSDSQVSI